MTTFIYRLIVVSISMAVIFSVVGFSLLWNNYKKKCQSHNSFHGTLIVACEYTEGILLAADSRVNLSGELGYLEKCQKIFLVGQRAFAISGNLMNNGISIEVYIEEFKNQGETYRSIRDFLEAFLNHLKKRDKSFYDLFAQSSDKILATGFSNGVPEIVAFSKTGYLTARALPTRTINSQKFIKEFQALVKNNQADTKQVSKLLEQTIHDYITNNPSIKDVGGPISILKITPNSAEFIQNDFTGRSWKTFKEFAEDVVIKKINPTFTSEEVRKKYISYLENDILK